MQYKEEEKNNYFSLGLKYKRENEWEKALDNLFIAKHIFEMHEECNEPICDIMITNCSYVSVLPYLRDYICADPTHCIRYSLLYVFIKIMLANRNDKMDTIDTNEYLNLDPNLDIFHLPELVESVKKRDLDRFIKYIMFVDSIHDMDDDLVMVLLCLKTEIWFQNLCEKNK